MTNADITKYFDKTEFREIRKDLVFAIKNISEPKIAIDCGCGAGADIDYLASNDFVVHGFDLEEESISRCKARFKNTDNVFLAKSSFNLFRYPQASLVAADASLFFCPISEFPSVWEKMYECLYPGGIFCGSFLGPEDSMANPGHPSVFWPDVAVFEEAEVRNLFEYYEILRFNVHRTSGTTLLGTPHDWHIFSVVAKKLTSDDPNKHLGFEN
ncbi:MAG: methyltransferase domain-containing protein [Pseudomonadales bacterium]|nr:methyltransferase domain-containing protein [Pseudomonadales bacterium]